MLHLPKFKLEHQFSAKDLLMNLGMKDVFTDGAADLSGISGNKDLHVSQVGTIPASTVHSDKILFAYFEGPHCSSIVPCYPTRSVTWLMTLISSEKNNRLFSHILVSFVLLFDHVPISKQPIIMIMPIAPILYDRILSQWNTMFLSNYLK